VRSNVQLLCNVTKFVRNIYFPPSASLALHIFVILAWRTLFYCQSAQVNAQKQKDQGANASDNAVKFLKVS
jgi:hypothetical protein